MERDELIRDVEIKYPQTKTANEFEVEENMEYEEVSQKKAKIKTNGS
jgi:hypothetical protein